MSEKSNNFYDDYFKTRIKLVESTEVKVKNRKKTDRMPGTDKYRATAHTCFEGKKTYKHLGTFDNIDEAVEAQMEWKNMRATNKEVADAGKKVMDKYAKAIKNLGDR